MPVKRIKFANYIHKYMNIYHFFSYLAITIMDTMQIIAQPPIHNPAPRRKNNKQSIHAMASERMSLGDAAKLVINVIFQCFHFIKLLLFIFDINSH